MKKRSDDVIYVSIHNRQFIIILMNKEIKNQVESKYSEIPLLHKLKNEKGAHYLKKFINNA